MKLSLEKTWSECLRMWGWICSYGVDFGTDVDDLKSLWMTANGYEEEEFLNDCFFCEYADTHSGIATPPNCKNCPGQKVDPEFGCTNDDYHFFSSPVEFLFELKRLNDIRIAKNKKRNKK